ncbi:hypothetical protein G3I59_09090 [Amycolatopsis rubida]|uniref:Uncharacterized protein n=1 Tax=Amycolatopsis rubida TaxID=112413 RepID=A0ABX0BKD4_9PSEU|nr:MULTISPECIES: hypothetical protein [Amycolatopsis]MYW90758.1 hypothetical protein [Amycolatopsis rubida]NEC55741.1 hypothetical protein [Amycolatopsis rubida]
MSGNAGVLDGVGDCGAADVLKLGIVGGKATMPTSGAMYSVTGRRPRRGDGRPAHSRGVKGVLDAGPRGRRRDSGSALTVVFEPGA